MWCVRNTWWSVAELAPTQPLSLISYRLSHCSGPAPSPPSFLTRNTGHALESQCPHGSLLQAPWSWRCPLPSPSPANTLPLPWLDQVSSLKIPLTQLELVVSIGALLLQLSQMSGIMSHPTQCHPGQGWGPFRSVPRAQMGLGTRPRKRGRWAHRRTQAHNLLLHPLAPRQTEILPSVYSLPCPNLPTSTTTSPAPEESNSQPLSQQDRSQSLWKEWPGAVLLPYHVDRDPELQQPLQNAHPPVPGHHILLSFVIQKPPACQGPWGAHAPSP